MQPALAVGLHVEQVGGLAERNVGGIVGQVEPGELA
jgi:hypothetical protein